MLQGLLYAQAALDGHIRWVHVRDKLNPGLAIVLTDSRKARVMCNSIEPGGKPVPVFESAQFPVGLHEAVLAKIHCLIPVPYHAQDEVINGLFPLADQKVERFRIAFENAFDDLPVIRLHNTKTPVSSKKTKFMRFFFDNPIDRTVLGADPNELQKRARVGPRKEVHVGSLLTLLNREIEALPTRRAEQNCSCRRLSGGTAKQNELRRVAAAIDNMGEYHFGGRTLCRLFGRWQRGDQEIAPFVITASETYHRDCIGGGQLHSPFERARQGRENLAGKLCGFSSNGNAQRTG